MAHISTDPPPHPLQSSGAMLCKTRMPEVGEWRQESAVAGGGWYLKPDMQSSGFPSEVPGANRVGGQSWVPCQTC